MRLLIELDKVEIMRAIEVYVEEVLGYKVTGKVGLARFEGDLIKAVVCIEDKVRVEGTREESTKAE